MANPPLIQSECANGARKAIWDHAKALAEQAGEAVYEKFASIMNAFIDQVKSIIDGAIAILEPIITFDEFVMDTFVKPPLLAIADAVEQVQNTIKKPLSMLAINDPECPDTDGVSHAINAAVSFMEGDIDKFRNFLASMTLHRQWQTDLINAMKTAQTMVDSFHMPPTLAAFNISYESWFGS